jgi:class 3 adenylate cyclase
LSRLAPLDKALVLILVPLWIVVFTLGVRTQIREVRNTAIAISVDDADSYPALTGVYLDVFYDFDPLAEAGLRAGDRLIRYGGVDLRGVDTRDLLALSSDEAVREPTVPLVFEREGERFETSIRTAPASVFRPLAAVSFAFAVSAIFLMLRAQPTPTVRAYFQFAMCHAIGPCIAVGSPLEVYAGLALWTFANLFYHATMIRFALLFPDSRMPKSPWHRIWPWIFAIPFSVATHFMFSSRMGIAQPAFLGITLPAAAAVLAVITYKYRSLDRVGRRQMKWVVIGAYCAVLPILVAGTLTSLDPRLGWLWFMSFWGVPLVPVALVISVMRFNLFDVDRLLSAAASYNILVVVLATGALVVVPRFTEAASGVVGIDPGTGQIALSLLLAGALVPAHRRLRPQIDRAFFKERYALDHGIAELLPTLSACTDARELTERAGTGLHSLFQPEACVVYAVAEDSYAPVFVEGRGVPPGFAAESPLVASLAERRAPLSLSATGRRPDETPLGPFDRAALETLGAEVVVPVRQGDALSAFLCLGPKRSGDVYTSTDLSLLAAVAETVSRELRHFDQQETIREATEMQESLRRYVPGAVAEQLSAGGDLRSGEREVSVLFVDIRGYTGFAESRRAEEIFSTVNRYTEMVSQIVQRHGGSVVEFNGDGMMVVFGAPRELAHKERAAVEAGREIVEAVAGLTIDDVAGEPTTLSVGVGIATGEAFVGNIQAVDRMIWSAIGNTTNLAARLQSLTRDLDASLVVDAGTWERAQPAAAQFEKRSEVPIRGRRETQDVYALPMPRAPWRSPA